jgi:tRNA-Thr(GGU) m(6)t(6)A37 methyltransferase TsaA
MDDSYSFRPIGLVRSCYTGKFGIPRQPGLVTAAEARLELFAEFAREEAFAGLEGFSHLWLLFVFHDAIAEGWRPTVRPPRLGGRRKVGVFASRSPHRPNPIGLSAVEFRGFVRGFDREGNGQGGLALRLGGVDLLDGTPVLDIKPYVPYADCLPQASSGFVPPPRDQEREVIFSPQALAQARELSQRRVPAQRVSLTHAQARELSQRQVTAKTRAPGQAQSLAQAQAQTQEQAAAPDGERHLVELVTQVLRQDPRPGYMDRYPERQDFAMRLYDLEVRWRENQGRILVTALELAAD